jgi:hypothetical protein
VNNVGGIHHHHLRVIQARRAALTISGLAFSPDRTIVQVRIVVGPI